MTDWQAYVSPEPNSGCWLWQNKNSISRVCKQCVLDGNKRRRLEGR